MRVRLLLAAAATLALAACSGDTTTAPGQLKPADAAKEVITCRSGYHVATREDGSQECDPD